MSKLNSNIPHFKAKVKKSYFTKNEKDSNEYYDVICFGIQSIAGKILTFHIITDSGMMRSRVPLSEIYIKEPNSDIPFHYKQLWDCFSENVSVTHYDFLEYHRAQIVLRDGNKVWGQYSSNQTSQRYSNPTTKQIELVADTIFAEPSQIYQIRYPNKDISVRVLNFKNINFS